MPRAPSAILYTYKGASVGSPFSSQTSPGYAGNYTYKDIVRPYMKVSLPLEDSSLDLANS